MDATVLLLQSPLFSVESDCVKLYHTNKVKTFLLGNDAAESASIETGHVALIDPFMA